MLDSLHAHRIKNFNYRNHVLFFSMSLRYQVNSNSLSYLLLNGFYHFQQGFLNLLHGPNPAKTVVLCSREKHGFYIFKQFKQNRTKYSKDFKTGTICSLQSLKFLLL